MQIRKSKLIDIGDVSGDSCKNCEYLIFICKPYNWCELFDCRIVDMERELECLLSEVTDDEEKEE